MYEILLDKATVPSHSEMVAYCAQQGERFERFHAWAQETFSALAEVKFPCGSGGWIHFRVESEELYRDIITIMEA